MEMVVANVTGKVRRETRNGREYLVAPATLLFEHVLDGSQGALFYPQDAISENPSDWDGIPLVVDHPTLNGLPVSARHPDVMGRSEIGRNYLTKFDGKLTSENWFDVLDTKRVDNRIYDALIAGKSIELSTGLNIRSKEKAPEGASFKGKPYTHIARGYKPDHIAILPDKIGACSIKDGCGVNNAKRTHIPRRRLLYELGRILGLVAKEKPTPTEEIPVITPEATMNRIATIDFLVANCESWKDSKSELEKLSDAQLTKLKDSAEKAKITANAVVKVETTPVVQPAPVVNTEIEQLKTTITALNASVQSLVAQRTAGEEQTKKALVEALVANLAEPIKQHAIATYQSMSAEMLASLMAISPIANQLPRLAPHYVGAAGVQGGSQPKDDSDNLMPILTVNFDEMASPKLRKQA